MRGGDAKPGICAVGADSPVAGAKNGMALLERDSSVKANLARFTTALVILASMALVLGAGMRWSVVAGADLGF